MRKSRTPNDIWYDLSDDLAEHVFAEDNFLDQDEPGNMYETCQYCTTTNVADSYRGRVFAEDLSEQAHICADCAEGAMLNRLESQGTTRTIWEQRSDVFASGTQHTIPGMRVCGWEAPTN